MLVFAAWAALSLSCTSLVFGVTGDGVTVGVLAWVGPPAGELWLVRAWHLSPNRSTKDFTPVGHNGKLYIIYLLVCRSIFSFVEIQYHKLNCSHVSCCINNIQQDTQNYTVQPNVFPGNSSTLPQHISTLLLKKICKKTLKN